MNTYTHTHTYIYTYIYTYVYTHTHTYVRMYEPCGPSQRTRRPPWRTASWPRPSPRSRVSYAWLRCAEERSDRPSPGQEPPDIATTWSEK